MTKGKVIGEGQDAGILIFDPSNWRERIYRHIVEHRITTETTVEILGRRANRTALLVVDYSVLRRAIFIWGRRIR